MRTRLSNEQRRAQLLAIGAELFARRPYEEVSVDQVAAIAQISCGLLYHYFPSKREFFLAIVEDESAKLLRASTPDPALPPLDQLKAGLDVYIDYAERHPDSFRVAQHAAITDHDLQRLHDARVTAQRDRILTGLGAMTNVDDEAKIAVTGWLALVQTVILNWLDDPAISREQLRDLCARALWAAVGLLSAADATSRQ
ncbi:MAG: TetR/AcrR family transcriptional regulator [Mycobacterium sp.]|nr:TetR/AcrR family transcriptional regulator [Mycobacterium sp.]